MPVGERLLDRSEEALVVVDDLLVVDLDVGRLGEVVQGRPLAPRLIDVEGPVGEVQLTLDLIRGRGVLLFFVASGRGRALGPAGRKESAEG